MDRRGASGTDRRRRVWRGFLGLALNDLEIDLTDRRCEGRYVRGFRLDDGLWVYRIRPGTITRDRVDRFYREAKIPVEPLTRSRH